MSGPNNQNKLNTSGAADARGGTLQYNNSSHNLLENEDNEYAAELEPGMDYSSPSLNNNNSAGG